MIYDMKTLLKQLRINSPKVNAGKFRFMVQGYKTYGQHTFETN